MFQMATDAARSGSFQSRFAARWRPLGPLRAHSSPGLSQKRSAHHPQIAQCEQRVQLRRVLGKPSIAHFHMAELALDDPERVFHLGPDACLYVFELVHDRAQRRALVQDLAFARAQRYVPVHINALSLFALGNALVSRVSEHICFFAMHQRTGLRHVVDVGSRTHHGVHQARIGINTDVRLHPEVPLIALLRLVHLGVALAAAVLGRTGRGYQRGIDHRALLEQQSLGCERGVDRGQHLHAQVVLLQQVTEPQNGALVGQALLAHVQPGEFAKHRRVVQRFFHRRVRQVEPLLQEVDAQHGLDRKRRATAFGAGCGCVRRNQRHQFGPRHHQVHLVEELALARPLRLALVSALAQAHLFHAVNVACPVPTGRFCRPSLSEYKQIEVLSMNYTVNLAIFASRESVKDLVEAFEHAKQGLYPGSFIDVLINGNEELATHFVEWCSKKPWVTMSQCESGRWK